MVILVSIICIGLTVIVASVIGRLLRYLRERQEKDDERLKFFERINNDIENIINGKEEQNSEHGGDNGC